MSTRKTVVFTTSAKVQPAASRTAPMLRSARSAWAGAPWARPGEGGPGARGGRPGVVRVAQPPSPRDEALGVETVPQRVGQIESGPRGGGVRAGRAAGRGQGAEDA